VNENQHSLVLTKAPNDARAVTALSEFDGNGDAQQSRLNLNDILFILFRHKTKSMKLPESERRL
jgi:hypothetical protein